MLRCRRADYSSLLCGIVVELEKDAEPELLKAVKYALKEYPCLLHCLVDGTLDFSNNAAERQIRIIAAYRKFRDFTYLKRLLTLQAMKGRVSSSLFFDVFS